MNEEYGYAYDALGRLKAAWTGSAAWGLEWDYDGFGNRYAQRVTKGSAPVASFVVDQTKNRLIGTGWAYDANGNATSTPAVQYVTYDIENRLVRARQDYYSPENVYTYDAANRRLTENGVFNFYGLNGELLGQYEQKNDGYASNSNRHMRRVDNSMRVWFAGRLVRAGASWDAKYTDRLGSVVTQSGLAASYYPYGEEVAATTNDGREKYATYRRDATGLDYAWNRMYSSTYGRFLQADPYRASASMTNPQSWNRYAYVENDPVNFNDRTGLFLSIPDVSSDPLASEQYFCASQGDMNTDPGSGNPFYGYPGQLPFLCATPGPQRPNYPLLNVQCFAQLKSRPVNDWRAKAIGAVHTFWWVQGSKDNLPVQYLLSGGPQNDAASGKDYIGVWATPRGRAGEDRPSAKKECSSGLSADNCDAVNSMIEAAKAFPEKAILYDWSGPNSNSVARYLGAQGGFTPDAPSGAVGWGSSIEIP